jgi:adenylate/nucleoside-diphosphate kinase
MTKADPYYSWEQENEKSNRIIEFCKEIFSDEIVSVIEAQGTEDDVTIKIRMDIDPFYLRVDNPDDVRVSADLDEDARKLPKGDFGDYCPVTYVNDNFL